MNDVWKSEEEVTYIKPNFSQIFWRNRQYFEKYVQILVSQTSSNFKTPRCSLKMLGFTWQFQHFLVFGNRRKSDLRVFEVLLDTQTTQLVTSLCIMTFKKPHYLKTTQNIAHQFVRLAINHDVRTYKCSLDCFLSLYTAIQAVRWKLCGNMSLIVLLAHKINMNTCNCINCFHGFRDM